MSVDLSGPHSLPSCEEASNSGDSSPMPAVHLPEENYSCLQVSATEMLCTETGKELGPGRTKLTRVRVGKMG